MENLNVTMFETLKSDLSGVSIDCLEIGIDCIFEEGLLKDIPIINSFVSLCKTGVNIREHFLIKKLMIFLVSLSETKIEKRLEFIHKHEEESTDNNSLNFMNFKVSYYT